MQTVAWVALILVASVFGAFAFSLSRKYSGLYAPAHLVEICSGIARMRDEALAGQRVEPPHAITTAGLVICYTHGTDAGRHRHHVSFSYQGGASLAFAAATPLAVVMLDALQTRSLGIATTAFRAESGVFHLAFDLDESQHAKFMSTAVSVPDRGTVRLPQIPSQEMRTFWHTGEAPSPRDQALSNRPA
jgi:hypothetical protein